MLQYSLLAAAVPNSVAVEETAAAASDAKKAAKAADRLNQTSPPPRRARRKLMTIGRISPTKKKTASEFSLKHPSPSVVKGYQKMSKDLGIRAC